MSGLIPLLETGKVKKGQLGILGIFNVKDSLQQRGFVVRAEGVLDATFLSKHFNTAFDLGGSAGRAFGKRLFSEFDKRSFRIELRKNIEEGKSGEFALDGHNIPFVANDATFRRYTDTMEALVAYQCVTELRALSASFAVHVEGAPDGGDYDCIANFQNDLYVFEVKTTKKGASDQAQIKAFLARHDFLSPNASVLFFDYMGIRPAAVVQQFQGLPIGPHRRVERILQVELDGKTIYAIDSDIIVIDIAKSGDFLPNLRVAKKYLARLVAASTRDFFSQVHPRDLGLAGEILWAG